MANTFLKLPLSASVDGRSIMLTSTGSSSAVPIHTAPAGTSSLDEIWLYAYNDSSATINLALLFGGTTEPNDVIRNTIQPRSGRTLVVDGAILQNGLIVSAYAEVANVVTVGGYVHRITP